MPTPIVLLPALVLALVILLRPMAATAQTEAVNLELLLAVDCSSSVSDEEFALQMRGIARAFEDPPVLAAIEQIGGRGIAVGLLQWSSTGAQTMAIGWTRIDGVGDALALAKKIRRTSRLIPGGATSLSGALTQAVAAIERNGFVGERQVIDVSGDGRANEGESPAHARAYANRIGITVNGLAILNEEPDLTDYYRAWVVGGPGSFLLIANDFHDFAEAMRRKLYFEIVGTPVAAAPGGARYGSLTEKR